VGLRNKILAAASVLTLAGGLAAAGAATSNAATPSCGHRCVNLFSKKFSDALTTKPGYVIDVLRQAAAVGQPLIMFQSSNSDPAEDFTVALQGTVSDFIAAGLVSKNVGIHYANDLAWEFEYSPNGADSGLCIGLPSAPINNAPVSLQPCGVSSRTVWVTDSENVQRGGVFTFPYVPLINGADTNFSHPFVLTYPSNGNPGDKPRPQLVTQTLHQYSHGQVYDNQQWSAFFGVLH